METTTKDRSRKDAARVIRRIERDGGFRLRCGCLVAARAVDFRRLMECSSPEAVLDVERALEESHHHAADVSSHDADLRISV